MRSCKFVVALCVFTFAVSAPVRADQKPLSLPDVLAWKRMQTPVISNDGHWFAYKLVPNDGNSQVVLKNVDTGAEQRFDIGEVVRPNPYVAGGMGMPPPVPHDVVFSDDSKWLAFNVHPTQTEGRQLKKQHKPLEDKVVLVALATGKKTEFDRIRRFAFSGERASAIALQRYPATPAGPAGAAAAATPAPNGAKPDDKPAGSDLVLLDLTNNEELNLGNVSDFAFDKKGNWFAWIVDAQDKLGNGINLRNMNTGMVATLDSGKAVYKSLNWTEKGDGLAAVRGIDDKRWEDKVYTLVAFKEFKNDGPPEKVVYEPSKDKSFPEAMTISAERRPAWMADLSEVTFGIHELKPKEPKTHGPGTRGSATAKPAADADSDSSEAKEAGSATKADDSEDKPDLVIWHWKDSRLQSMQQVQENRDKNFSYLCAYIPSENKFVRLGSPEVKEVSAAPEAKFASGIDVRAYELESNLDGRRYEDVYVVNLKTGERKLALRKARWTQGVSPDGTHMLYYEDGNFFTYNFETGRSQNLTKSVPAVFIDTDDDHNVVKPPTRSIGWSKDSKCVLLTDKWDIWKVPADGGAAVNLTRNGKQDKIRYEQIWKLDPDDKGFDLSKPLYVRAYGEWTKKGGIGVVDPENPGVRMLHWDDAAYMNLLKAKNADVFAYSRESTQNYPDFYVAGSSLADGKRVSDANPQQKNFLWTKGVKLVEYTGIRGDKLQGALYLPANYDPQKKYPTVVYIYEKLSQAANSYPQPGFNGFSVGYYTSNGYAVLTPDITYKVNDPGVSSINCILAALKAAEATGVIDPDRVALHGHSWGGYQTAFAVTQTKAFRAAIAGAPLTDMIAMYNAIYWNTGTGNMAIFESSQGRFTGGPWENTEAYIRNSPVYHATNVQTPLLILCNDKDGAVDHTQGIEYYNTLRRMGKPVVMLEYVGENHGLFKPEDMKDYTVRMKEFFDHFLMDKPAPAWWTDGVPRLKIKDELSARSKELEKQATTPAEATPLR
ncbi:MAG TPA: prolyl oligopeptidase family serine peptidase [Bryobacteraceae bacterium]|nr:prolyl oligopeptidase family serine peptidase [Bryobacteraceae bacterium]